MSLVVPAERDLDDRRELLADVKRIFLPGYVDVCPADDWPDDATISVPAFTDQQRQSLGQLGFHVDEL